MTDYYEVLGVSKSATSDEVKKAYRRLAKQFHPDSKSGSGDEARFKKINEAYQVLSDPKKKQAYDQFGDAAFAETGGFGRSPFGFDFGGGFTRTGRTGPFTYTHTTQGGPDFDLGDLFGGAFSTIFGESPFGRVYSERRRRGRDLHYQLTVDFGDAVRGAEHSIRLPGRSLQTGGPDVREVKIRIPQGARDGLELKFAGEGEVGIGPRGEALPRGDLYVRVNVNEPAGIMLRGSDIYTEKEISVYDALLGGEVPVAVVDSNSNSGLGEGKLKIPAGTQSGTTFRLSRKGMPYLRGRGRGDAYIRIKVKIPEKLSRREKEMLEKLRG